MKLESITKAQYDKIIMELREQNTDFFGDNKLSTLLESGDEYSILTFDDATERNSFIKEWRTTASVSQKERGNRHKIEKLKV